MYILCVQKTSNVSVEVTPACACILISTVFSDLNTCGVLRTPSYSKGRRSVWLNGFGGTYCFYRQGGTLWGKFYNAILNFTVSLKLVIKLLWWLASNKLERYGKKCSYPNVKQNCDISLFVKHLTKIKKKRTPRVVFLIGRTRRNLLDG